MILIAAVGRSGTHYTANLMQAIGLDIPHEVRGRDGTASWKHITTGTFTIRKRWRRPRHTFIDGSGFDTVLHQVRHPLKVVASMQTFSDATWRYMALHTSLNLDQPPLERAMRAYVQWNALIEPRACWRFQVERLAEQFDQLCLHVGVEPRPLPQLPAAARDSRTSRFQPVTWNDLRAVDPDWADRLRHTAIRYGYPVD